MLVEGEVEFDPELLEWVVAEVAKTRKGVPPQRIAELISGDASRYCEALGFPPLTMDALKLMSAIYQQGLLAGYHYRAEETFLRLVGRNQRTT